MIVHLAGVWRLLVVLARVRLATAGLTCIWFALGSAGGARCWRCFARGALAPDRLVRGRFRGGAGADAAARKKIHQLPHPADERGPRGRRGGARAASDIDNLEATGAVAVDGKVWTARSADGGVIAPGAVVTVERIEGVKLIVDAAQQIRVSKTAEEETEHA